MEDDNVEHIKCLNYNTFRESKVDDISSSSENDMSQVEEDISILKATLNIIWKAFPSMLMIFIFDGILFSNIIFLEHQNNSISISGCGFGLTIINVLILPVSYGVTEGMSCLVSKAYGRKDYESCSVHINQCRYVLLALAILQFIAIIFLEYIFEILGQPVQISHYAWIFCMLSFPGVLSSVLIKTNYCYLVCCEVNYAGVVINIFIFIFHIIALYFSVIFFGYGIFGGGICTTVSMMIYNILFEIQCRFYENNVHKLYWKLPTFEVTTKLKEFLQYAIPLIFTNLLYLAPIEICVMMAGNLGSSQLTASTMYGNISSFIHNIFGGLCFSFSTLIGNSLGENNPNKAKTYKNSALVISLIIVIIIVMTSFISKSLLISYYINSSEEEFYTKQVFEIYLIEIVIEIFIHAIAEILVFLEYQYEILFTYISLQVIAKLLFCYLISFVFSFGYLGLRIAYVSTSGLLLLVFFFFLLRADWNKLALKASREHAQN